MKQNLSVWPTEHSGMDAIKLEVSSQLLGPVALHPSGSSLYLLSRMQPLPGIETSLLVQLWSI